MRPPVTGAKIEQVMSVLGQEVTGPGAVFFTGGVTALLHGWRDTTIDIDIKAMPEPAGFFQAIALLKEREAVNIELASPDDFIPEIPGWRERSLFIDRRGSVDFYHYDPYAQALAKIERAHTRDVADAESMVAARLVDRAKLLELFAEIEPGLIRYPAIKANVFRRKVERFVAS